MKSFRMIAFALALGAMIIAPTACKKEGLPEKSDKAAKMPPGDAKEKLKEAMEKAGTDLGAAVDKAADKVDEAAENAADKVEEAAEKVEEAAK